MKIAATPVRHSAASRGSYLHAWPMVLALGMALAAHGPATLAQTILDLGTLGGNSTTATGVNQDGTVVVGETWLPGDGTEGLRRAYRWVSGSGMQDLGLVTGTAGGAATAVNADGTVVVGYARDTGVAKAFRWTLGGGMQELGALWILGAGASGVSADGAIVSGSSSAFSGIVQSHMTRWSGGPNMQSIGTAGLGAVSTGISRNGTTIVGWSQGFIGPDIGIYWTQPAGIQGLAAPAPNIPAHALAVSDNGDVIAGYGYFAGFNRAIRWVSGIPEDIGVLSGEANAQALALSAYGDVAGGMSSGGAGSDGAWIWMQTRGMVRLSTFLTGEGVNLTGWTLDSCTGISTDGYALVGNGLHFGQPRAFVARVLHPVCGPWIMQPPVSIDICDGSTGGLQCDAFGPTFHSPSFQWYKFGTFGWGFVTNGPTGSGMTISGAQSPTLTFSNAAFDAEGYYVVEVTAGCGAIVTSPVFVRYVAGPPAFADDGILPQACSHGGATMNVYPGPPNVGPFVLQWQRETAPGSNVYVDLVDGATGSWDGNAVGVGGIVSGATTSSLTITADTGNSRQLAKVHSRGYRCIATNPCGSASFGKFLSVTLVGDANCDGSVNSFDIDPFVQFVLNPGAALAPGDYLTLGYTQACWDLKGCWADLNHDGNSNNFDIDAFVACILNVPPAGRPCP